MPNTLMTREEWYQYVRDCVEEAFQPPRKKIFILLEHEYGEVYVQVFTTKELAEKYKKNECTGYVTITEQYIIGE